MAPCRKTITAWLPSIFVGHLENCELLPIEISRGNGISAIEQWLRSCQLFNELACSVSIFPHDWIVHKLKDSSRNKRAIGKTRPLTFEVSNVGAQNFSSCQEQGDGHADKVTKNAASVLLGQKVAVINRLVFSQSTMVTAGLFTISAAGIDAGPISISISWQNKAFELDIAKTFCKDMEYWLRYISCSK